MVNTVVMEGNLCREPSITATHTGTSVCTLEVEIGSRETDDGLQDVFCMQVLYIGETAVFVHQDLSKGDAVRVVGSLGRLRWRAGAPDGAQTAPRIIVMANTVEAIRTTMRTAS